MGQERHGDETGGTIGHDEADDEGASTHGLDSRLETDSSGDLGEHGCPVGSHQELGGEDDGCHKDGLHDVAVGQGDRNLNHVGQ